MDFYHKEVTTFSCSSVNCFRSFHIFSSYRRHYLTCHHLTPTNTVNNDKEIEGNATNSNEEVLGDIINDNIEILDNLVNTNDGNVRNPSQKDVILQKNSSIPMDMSLAQLMSSLYANPQVPQNVADTVFDGIKRIFDYSVFPILEQSSITSDTIVRNIDSSLSNLGSYHLRLKYFEDHGSYIEPISYTVGSRYDFVRSDGLRLYKAVESKAHFIPLRNVLEKFFLLPDMLRETLQHMNDLLAHDATQTIEHFLHGFFWQYRRALHQDKLVLPIFLQIDDFEPLNALGSHSSIHKLGAAYVSLPCLSVSADEHIFGIVIPLFRSSGVWEQSNISTFN